MWKLIGSATETRLVECDEGTLSYDEAKLAARKQLNDCLGPLTVRLGEIEQDIDWAKGKKPICKAWVSDYGNKTLVTAKTKKRAAEIVGYSRSGFDGAFTRCNDLWWYEYAQEEGEWVRASIGYFDLKYEKKF